MAKVLTGPCPRKSSLKKSSPLQSRATVSWEEPRWLVKVIRYGISLTSEQTRILRLSSSQSELERVVEVMKESEV